MGNIRKFTPAFLIFFAAVFVAVLSAAPRPCPSRILSLTPSVTEMLFAVGAGSQVVGVTTADDYPAAVKHLPRVGGVEFDEERILALKPDLVVGEDGLVGGSLRRLRSLGLRVLALHTRKLLDIPASLKTLGRVTGHPRQADALASHFLSTLKRISALARRSPPVRVFVELGSRPLLTTGNGTFLAELIACAGGKNIAAGLPRGFQMISPEEVVAASPEVIITADGESWGEISKRSGWGGIPAVIHKRVYPIDPDLVMRPGPRILQGLVTMAAWFHRP